MNVDRNFRNKLGILFQKSQYFETHFVAICRLVFFHQMFKKIDITTLATFIITFEVDDNVSVFIVPQIKKIKE